MAGLFPDSISIVGNTITNPYSCGIYVASARNLRISGNRISGQRDRYDVTLPKGAIALNHASHVQELRDNELLNNYIGITAVGSDVNMGANHIVAAPGGRESRIVP
jgi:parallel beta-helix repeat protein